jgi:hypothetical protein
MNIEDLTIKQAKELSKMFSGDSCKQSPFDIGKKYLIRTVTHIDVGQVTEIIGDFVRLKDASWIADTGRYHDCLSKGIFNEIEPYPSEVTINCSAIIDFSEWNHTLPTEQK